MSEAGPRPVFCVSFRLFRRPTTRPDQSNHDQIKQTDEKRRGAERRMYQWSYFCDAPKTTTCASVWDWLCLRAN